MQTLYLDDLCRICMGTNKDKQQTQHNIFEHLLVDSIAAGSYDELEDTDFVGEMRLCDAMQQITALDVNPNDGLPAALCELCERRVIDAFLLRHRAERTHHTLIDLRDKNAPTYDKPTASSSVKDDFIILAKKSPDGDEGVELYDVQSLSLERPPKSHKARPKIEPQLRCSKFEIKLMGDDDDDDDDEEDGEEDEEHAMVVVGTGCGDTDEQVVVEQVELEAADEEEVVEEEEEEEASVDGEEDAVAFLLANAAKSTDTQADRAESETELGATTKAGHVRHPRSSEPTLLPPPRRHKCNVCDRTFMRKSNLIDHLRLHANQRPFECEICAKSFVQAGNLRAHMRVHTKERPYECQVCHKTYNQSGALKVHIRVHTNERNYKCSYCPKAFTNSTDRNKHQRVHDPTTQIKCELCPGRTFAQRVNYMLHMKKQHGVGKEDAVGVEEVAVNPTRGKRKAASAKASTASKVLKTESGEKK